MHRRRIYVAASKGICSITPPPAASVRRGWSMSRTPSGWTATKSVLLVAVGLGAGVRAPALTVLRRRGNIVTIPLAPRTARASELAIGERVEGQIFLLRGDGQCLDRHPPTCIVAAYLAGAAR